MLIKDSLRARFTPRAPPSQPLYTLKQSLLTASCSSSQSIVTPKTFYTIPYHPIYMYVFESVQVPEKKCRPLLYPWGQWAESLAQ